jgi:hypothetical protein
MYSKTFNLKTTDDEPGKLNFYDATDEGGIAAKTPQVIKRRFDLPAMLNFPQTEIILPLYSELFNRVPRKYVEDGVTSDGTLAPTEVAIFPNVDEVKESGEDNSVLLGKNGFEKYKDKIELSIERPAKSYYEKIKDQPTRKPKFLESDALGMYTTNDAINKLEVGGTSGADFIPLKFHLIGGNTIQFRATINGLSETMSPSWDSNRFIGSPFNYYTYTGVERSVSFNFKVFSLNPDEHNNAWSKLNELTGMVYPAGYANDIAVIPPIVEFTLGNMYSKKTSFIESLSYTIDDNFPWEVEKKGLLLPMLVDVSIGLKFIESKSGTNKKNKYQFNPTT